jgi:F420 biosynthesis protein FbiB-like protein
MTVAADSAASPAASVSQAIRGRRSVRSYRTDPVSDQDLNAVVDAARWAPSPHNSEPWRFVVVRTGAAKQRLATAMAERWQVDLASDGMSPEAIARELRLSHRRLTGAPVLLLVCLTDEGLDQYPDAQRAAAELTMATQSVGAAVQNAMLEAHARGLGTGWMCAPLFCPATVRGALGLSDDLSPQGIITLGYGLRQPPTRERRPLRDLLVEVQ